MLDTALSLSASGSIRCHFFDECMNSCMPKLAVLQAPVEITVRFVTRSRQLLSASTVLRTSLRTLTPHRFPEARAASESRTRRALSRELRSCAADARRCSKAA
jgi:hypothetical protein